MDSTASIVASQSHVAQALRVATAASVCLVIAEYYRLSHANLAVWTTHMVMVSVPFTSFQKGVERIIGRAVGIIAGLALHVAFPSHPTIQIALACWLMTFAFYVYFAGRLAYTALNAGLYLVAIHAIAQAEPDQAAQQGREMLLAVILGVVTADVVTWLSRGESDTTIKVGENPLWPIRGDWLSRSLMLVVTALLTHFATMWLEIPPTQAIISVMLLAVAPDLQSLIFKGELRLVGAGLGTGWALLSFVILTQVDHVLMLVILLFFGIFLAAYLARAGGDYAYAGVQMGLVLPLILIGPPSDFGDLNTAWLRLQGALAALIVSIAVGALWPNFARAAK